MNWQARITHLNSLSGIDKLLTIMTMLRDPEHGCPWDKKQTFQTIVPHTIEEAYEVADAIDAENFAELKKELGDLLFQVVFYAQLGHEQKVFNFEQIAESMCEKLISRHPHVFGDVEFDDEQQIKANWERQKASERADKENAQLSVLDDIPLAMPALSRAYKIQKRAASVGFDWPNVNGALDKVAEEINEVKQELNAEQVELDKIADELGDLYFALTNVTRHLGLKPEEVVRAANHKFEQRFRLVEQQAVEQQKAMTEFSLEELDAFWEKAKVLLKKA